MSIVEKAKNNTNVNALLHDIQQKVKVKFHRSQDEAWGSNMESGTAHIYYQKCKNPAAPLAHELLHIATQLRGYKRIRIGVSLYDQTPLFKRFMECIDNELQHHKFYNEFLEMELPPEEMYCENPLVLERDLKESIKSPMKFIEVLPDFFTLIAPGGSLTHEVKESLLKEVMFINGGEYHDQFKALENIVVAWRQSESYDNIPVIREIMLVLQPKPNFTWFGFNTYDHPPNQGFFVDEVFEIEND